MRSGASRGNWYALFPEGKGGARWWPGGLCKGTAGRGGPAGYARGRRGVVARRVYARGRRGLRPGGWLPCRFARHFVTGRGVAVKWGLRRRSPGVVVKRGCAAVDGGAAALLDCPPFGKPAAGGCREAERAGPAERTPAHSVCRSHCRGNREGDRLSRKAIRPGSPFHGGFVPAFGGRIIPMKRIANWNLKTI